MQHALMLLVVSLAPVAAAQNVAVVAGPRGSLDGIALGASLRELAGFTVEDGDWMRKGPLRARLADGRVAALQRTVATGDALRFTDGARQVTIDVTDRSTAVAEAIGTCGPIEPAEGASTIHCAGVHLVLGGQGLSVRLDANSKAPTDRCTVYPDGSGTWTVTAADRFCLGEQVFTAETTLAQAQRAIHMASEVVPDPAGERLRSGRTHLIFQRNRLVRIELGGGSPPPTPPAAPAPGLQARESRCGPGRVDDCRTACSSGDVEACATAGGLLSPDAAAVPLLQRACDGGSGMGCFNLGLTLEKGWSVAIDLPQARATYARGCQAGHGKSCGNLGALQLKGLGGPVDRAQGLRAHEKGCELGNGISCTALAYALADGTGVAKNAAKAERLFLRACDLGEGSGCDGFGVKLSRGDGYPVDQRRAYELFERACGNGNASGCANAGALLQGGNGPVARDRPLAKRRYEQACALGNGPGCTWVGIMLIAGDGVPQDARTGLQFVEKGCRLGDEKGCELARRK